MRVFIAIYLIALCCYFKTRTSDNKKARAVNKYIMATMYLIFAIVVFFKRYEFASYQTLLMAARLKPLPICGPRRSSVRKSPLCSILAVRI